MAQVRFRVEVAPGCSIGPGKISLLEGILKTGSLSAAARQLGMSYRRAWLLLDSLNHSFAEPVTSASVGGRGGGGVELTGLGRRLIEEYRDFEADVARLASRRWNPLAGIARPDRTLGAARRVTGKRAGKRASATGRGSKRP